jgi:hypothetical protein
MTDMHGNICRPEISSDILANRYFMEHQDAKSFLLNNKLSDLQYNPTRIW